MKKLTLIIILFCACALTSACALFVQDEKPHVHSYDEWVITVQPTCNVDGERERYCSCGEKQTGIIASLGHDFVVQEMLPPTCTEEGYDEYTVCSRCGEGDEITVLPASGHNFVTHEALLPTCTQSGYGEYCECVNCGLSDFVRLPELGHEYGEWFVTEAATCHENGEQTRVCLHDETHTETRETQKLQHNYTRITEEATCEASGRTYLKCTECGSETQFEDIPALVHDYGEWTVTVAPTCAAEGERMRVCSRNAEHTQKEVLSKLEHEAGEAKLVPPVCEAAGLSYTECVHCHALLNSVVVPALGHDFGEWQITPATCTAEGMCVRVCLRDCGCVETIYTEKLPHTPSEWIADGQTKYMECTVCHSELVREDVADESGLLFSLLPDGESYAISGVAFAYDKVSIPSVYNGKPVTAILTAAFSNCEIEILTIPKSVTVIYENAFKDCGLTSVIFENPQGWEIHNGDAVITSIPKSVTGNAVAVVEYLEYYSDYIWKCNIF